MGYDASGGRNSFIATSDGAVIENIDQNEFNQYNGQRLSHQYKADANGAFSVSTTPTNSPWNFYAFSNKILAPAFIDITTGNITVDNSVDSYNIAGTNSANVVGGMSWQNNLTGGKGTFTAAANWSVNIELGDGGNVILVTGTNIYGASPTDSVTIIRNSTATPNTVAYWRFEDGENGVENSSYADISGNDSTMTVSGATGTDDVPFPVVPVTKATDELSAVYVSTAANAGDYLFTAGSEFIDTYNFEAGWTIEAIVKFDSFTDYGAYERPGIVCKEGNNLSYPFFNLQLEPSSGKLRVVTSRDQPSERRFYSSLILVTGKWYAIAVTYDRNASGTDRAVKLYVKEETDSVYEFEGTSGGPWSSIILNGDTPWTIGRGMRSGNPKGYVDGIIDEVRISTSPLEMDKFLASGNDKIPFVVTTTENDTVIYSVSQFSVSGTNNANIVGGMTWLNELTGANGTFSAITSWTIPDIGLSVGENIISVSGTNINGSASGDSVTITRTREIPEPVSIYYLSLIIFYLSYIKNRK